MRFPTGVFQLDSDLYGGIPAGLVELVGEDGSGKTSLAVSLIKEARIRNLHCAYLSMQGSPDTSYFETAGRTDVVSVVPKTGEGAFEAAMVCLRRGVKVVVIDSIANVRPHCEERLPLGDREPLAYRMIYHGLWRIREEALRLDATVVLLNEVRADMHRRGRTKSAYDRVLTDLADLRVTLQRDKFHAEYGEVAWIRIRMLITQSALSPTGRVSFAHLFGKRGVDRNYELLKGLIASGLAWQRGAYFEVVGDTIGPGYARAAEMVGDRYSRYLEVLRARGQDRSERTR